MVPSSNLFFVLSSPSGVGKTTLARELLLRDSSLKLSVSATTRGQRLGEEEGTDYHFMTSSTFLRLEKEGGFLETAKIFGAFYGTPRGSVEKILSDGNDVLFDVNWQGAEALAKADPGRVVRVFLLPPSMEVLEERLVSRGTESDQAIARRLQAAEEEIAHWPDYDYVVTNDDMGEALDDLTAILMAERLRSHRFQAQA